MKAKYLTDSYAKTLTTKVSSLVDPTHIVLEDTIFYPQGGGQPSDTGVIVRASDNKEFAVKIAKKQGENIVHEVEEGLKEGDEILCSIDWERRYKLMRMHTSAHILSAIINLHTGALISGNQLNEEKSRIDFTLEKFEREAFDGYIAEANSEIAKGAPVTISFMARDAAMKIPHLVKLAGALPPAIQELRIVKIGEIDEQADGGTHVKDAKEIGQIQLLSLENKGKNNRRMYFTVQ